MLRRLWSRHRRLCLAGGFTLLALLMAEASIRFFAAATLRERGLVYHDQFGWLHTPNIRKVGRLWSGDEPAQINSRGWRDRETALRKPHGIRRIAALGDSFTFGPSVDYGERFTEILERDRPDREVLNFGVTAYGTDQQLRVLEEEAFRYAPDLVVLVVFFGNDLEDIRHARRFSWPRPHYDLEDGVLQRHDPVLTWDVRLRSASYLVEIAMRSVDRLVGRDRIAEGWADRDTVPLFAALVTRMRDLSRERGVPFVAVLTYPDVRLDGTPLDPERRARAALAVADVPTIDTFEVFAQRFRRDERLFGSDGHWNEAGHLQVAEILEAELGRLGL